MRVIATVALLVMATTPVLAEDLKPEIDEVSGNWAAISFNSGAETLICVAASADKKMVFRADSNALELRTGNDAWSLSADAGGTVIVKVGSVQKTEQMHTMDATTLTAAIDPADVTAIMDAMDKASTATLTFGNKKPVIVSLLGSTRALNSFRTCSAVHGFAKLGASAGPSASPF